MEKQIKKHMRKCLVCYQKKKKKKKSIAHHIIKNFDLGFSFGSSTFINASKHHWTYLWNKNWKK